MAFKKVLIVLLMTIFMLGASGCGKESSSEKVVKKVDDAEDSVKKNINKLMD